MSESPVPEELTQLDAELRGVTRRVERRIDPGPTAVIVSIAMLVVIGALLLPWSGSTRGWEILAGEASFGVLPRLFTFTALGIGVFGSALALATRRWGLAWVCAVGCGISVVNGVWAIWSRQIGVPQGGSGAAPGLILTVLAVLLLSVSWVRIALRR
ncbi:hypothetical protein [Pseudonocardia acidicola]|uniref:Uncharacterized protein n=1 Tax=Pseudonocardia acidicola TaxID=2724939 RepID=A0ABX1S5L4_9PSEU|nr:hypothetical protein [Pseudonocardia acidicola]NMH95862.1 hypothetical protein [Pseudonocardia acidicola]